jgi:hypothetical protein
VASSFVKASKSFAKELHSWPCKDPNWAPFLAFAISAKFVTSSASSVGTTADFNSAIHVH